MGFWVRTGRADLLELKEFDLIICNPFNKLPVDVIFSPFRLLLSLSGFSFVRWQDYSESHKRI